MQTPKEKIIPPKEFSETPIHKTETAFAFRKIAVSVLCIADVSYRFVF